MLFEFTFTIDNPKPKKRPRSGGRNIYTPEETRQYEKRVTNECFQLLQTWPPGTHEQLFKRPLTIDLHFHLKGRKLEEEGRPHTLTPDLDNLIKSLTDGMNGVVFKDDSQIFEINAKKTVTKEKPFVTITIKFI